MKINYPGGQFLAFTYCDCGRRMSMTDELGYALDSRYDAAGNLESLTDSDGVVQVQYTYDHEGLLEKKLLGNGVYSTYAYDAADQVLDLTNFAPITRSCGEFDYIYDDRGLRTSMTTIEEKWTYRYDGLGQLTGWTDPQGHKTDFVYDALGNRLSETDDGVVTNYTVNDLNQYTQVGATVYTYDADGNINAQGNGQRRHDVLIQC